MFIKEFMSVFLANSIMDFSQSYIQLNQKNRAMYRYQAFSTSEKLPSHLILPARNRLQLTPCCSTCTESFYQVVKYHQKIDSGVRTLYIVATTHILCTGHASISLTSYHLHEL